MDILSYIAVTVENHVPVKFEWIGDSNICAFSPELFIRTYAGEIPYASLNGKIFKYGPFTFEFKELTPCGDLVFERLENA